MPGVTSNKDPGTDAPPHSAEHQGCPNEQAGPAAKGVKLPAGLPRPRLIVFHCNRSVIKRPTFLHTRYCPRSRNGVVFQVQDPYARTVFSVMVLHSPARSEPVNSAMARTV